MWWRRNALHLFFFWILGADTPFILKVHASTGGAVTFHFYAWQYEPRRKTIVKKNNKKAGQLIQNQGRSLRFGYESETGFAWVIGIAKGGMAGMQQFAYNSIHTEFMSCIPMKSYCTRKCHFSLRWPSKLMTIVWRWHSPCDTRSPDTCPQRRLAAMQTICRSPMQRTTRVVQAAGV